MARRLIPILVAVLAVVGVTATGVGAGPSSLMVPVLAQTVEGDLHPADVPPEMTVVFLTPAGEGFSDGGDGPGGLEWVMGEGFSDGGDIPDGYVAVAALEADDAFWRVGRVPDGMIPVFGWSPDGFSDGGDLPEGYVAVLFRVVADQRGSGT
jgi:hypothetical protein